MSTGRWPRRCVCDEGLSETYINNKLFFNHNPSHDSSAEDSLIIFQNTIVVVVVIVWKPLVNAVDMG